MGKETKFKKMNKKTFKTSFLEYCKENNFEQNAKQIEVINLLNDFIQKKKLINLFNKPKSKLCFYLYGGVLGKTMILIFINILIYLNKDLILMNL